MRVPECEVLVSNNAVKNFIRTREFFKITSSLETGADHGMWTFQRYRTWLQTRKTWHTPNEPEAEAPDSEPDRRSFRLYLPLPVSNRKPEIAAPPQKKPSRQTGDRIEKSEPEERRLGKDSETEGVELGAEARPRMVGTPRRGITARVVAGGTGKPTTFIPASHCAAERGADGASAPSLPINTILSLVIPPFCDEYLATMKTSASKSDKSKKKNDSMRPYSSQLVDGPERAAARAMLYPVGFTTGEDFFQASHHRHRLHLEQRHAVQHAH